MQQQLKQLTAFFEQKDETGLTNLEKVKVNQKVIRRLETTDKNQSFEAATDVEETDIPSGIVIEDGKIIGFGIHIFNEDVYPLKYFEIYLRNCGLTGDLDMSGCKDIVFVDVYNNNIETVETSGMTALRILGLQHNSISKVDASQSPACQGIDIGFNNVSRLDVSKNPELVELYINDNCFTEIDLSENKKLKYFYCHNNNITELDLRANTLLRHLNATGNPMKRILTYAPQREELLPLEVHASVGGSVGMKFNPVYNAQWKETGEWQQSYYAYPDEGYVFERWVDENGNTFTEEKEPTVEYGSSGIFTAIFSKQ